MTEILHTMMQIWTFLMSSQLYILYFSVYVYAGISTLFRFRRFTGLPRGTDPQIICASVNADVENCGFDLYAILLSFQEPCGVWFVESLFGKWMGQGSVLDLGDLGL